MQTSINISHQVSEFVVHPENTMNAYTQNSALKAYQILYNQYGTLPKEPVECLNNLINKVMDDCLNLNLFDNEEDKKLFTQLVIQRINKNIYQDPLADMIPLKNVCWLVLSAIQDNKVEWSSGISYRDRLGNLKRLLTEILSEANCDVGARHKLLTALHCIYPGVYIVSEINAYINELAIEFYNQKFENTHQGNNKTAYKSLQALINYSLGQESKEEKKWVKEFYQNEPELKQYLQNKIKNLLVHQHHANELNNYDANLKLMNESNHFIDEVVQNRFSLPLPLSKGEEKSIIHLTQVLQMKSSWPKVILNEFETCKTLVDFKNNTLIHAFLLTKNLFVSIEPYLNHSYFIDGETEAKIYSTAKQIQECIHSINYIFESDEYSTLNLKYEELCQLEGRFNDAINVRAKEKDALINDAFALIFVQKTPQRIDCFEKLMDHFNKKNLVVTDELLGVWENQIEVKDNLPTKRFLTVPQMNRLFLTALSTIPYTWSDLFRDNIKLAVNFIEELNEDGKLAFEVKKSSYHPDLIYQLKWLIDVNHAGITENLPKLGVKLPFPCNLGNIKIANRDNIKRFGKAYELSPIVLYSNPMWLNIAVIDKVYSEENILAASVLVKTIGKLSQSQQYNFIHSYLKFLKNRCIKRTDFLIDLLCFLKVNNKSILLEKFGSETISQIVMANDAHNNNYESILSRLNSTQQSFFLNVLSSDQIEKILPCPLRNLKELFNVLDENNQIKLLQRLNIEKLKQNYGIELFTNFMEYLNKPAQLVLLQQLSNAWIISLIKKPYDLHRIAYYFDKIKPNSSVKLINEIEQSQLQSVIKDMQGLMICATGFTLEFTLSLLYKLDSAWLVDVLSQDFSDFCRLISHFPTQDQLNFFDLFELLIYKKIYKINQQNKDNPTYLISGLMYSIHPKMIELLLKNKADPNLADHRQNYLGEGTPLYMACQHEDISYMKLLLQYGASPEILNAKNNESPLHVLVNYINFDFHEKAKRINLLLAYKLNINVLNDKNETALHIALRKFSSYASKDNKEMVKYLLENGANSNMQNRNGISGLSMLMVQYQKRDRDLILCLLKHGADPNLQDANYGFTALHDACSNHFGNLEPIKILLEYGANPDIKASYLKSTCLHFECEAEKPNIKLIELLASYSKDLNITNEKGFTALDRCIKKCNYAAALVLLSHGASGKMINLSEEEKQAKIALCKKTYELFGNLEFLIEEKLRQEVNLCNLQIRTFAPTFLGVRSIKPTPKKIFHILMYELSVSDLNKCLEGKIKESDFCKRLPTLPISSIIKK